MSASPPRDPIQALRRAFHALFEDACRPFKERLAQAEPDHPQSPGLARILAFVG